MSAMATTAMKAAAAVETTTVEAAAEAAADHHAGAIGVKAGAIIGGPVAAIVRIIKAAIGIAAIGRGCRTVIARADAHTKADRNTRISRGGGSDRGRTRQHQRTKSNFREFFHFWSPYSI